jgi:hypothetical protein
MHSYVWAFEIYLGIFELNCWAKPTYSNRPISVLCSRRHSEDGMQNIAGDTCSLQLQSWIGQINLLATCLLLNGMAANFFSWSTQSRNAWRNGKNVMIGHAYICEISVNHFYHFQGCHHYVLAGIVWMSFIKPLTLVRPWDFGESQMEGSLRDASTSDLSGRKSVRFVK